MPALPESTGRVCCANNLLGGLTPRWPTKPPSSWGQSCAFWGLDPRFVSLRLRLLAVSALLSTLGPVGKMVERALARAKKPPGWVGTPMATRTAQGLGAGQRPSGSDPCGVGLGLCLCTSVCPISGVRNQDGGESLLTGGKPSSEVASVQRKAPQNRSCLPPGWSVKVSGRGCRA